MVGLFTGVAGSLIAALIIFLIPQSRRCLVSSWNIVRYYISMLRRLRSAGVSNFYKSRSDYAKYRGASRLTDYLRFARDSVKVAAYWMAYGNEAEGIADSIAEMVKHPSEIDVTIAIINPLSPFIDEIASYLNVGSKELVLRIQSSLQNLHAAKEKLSDEDEKRLIIKVYNTIPVASVIILDGDKPYGRIQLDFKAYKAPRDYSFGFEIRRPGQHLYNLCNNAWSSLIEDAEDFDPSKHLA